MVEHAADLESNLRRAAAELAVDDILALCYTFQHKPERLVLYLDVLRQRGDMRAQFASALICYDLARKGDVRFQRQFLLLADSMRAMVANQQLVEQLVGEGEYLGELWLACSQQLNAQAQEPALLEMPEAEAVPVRELNLLSQDDLAGIVIHDDDQSLQNRFTEAVDAFLGAEAGIPVYDTEAGFRFNSSSETGRIEQFLEELASLRDRVPAARGFRALTMIFYGAQLKSKTLFGGVNERKQALLRAGIREFLESASAMWEVVGVFNPLHAAPEAWAQVVDVLLDYVRWMRRHPSLRAKGPLAYDAVGRLMAREKGGMQK